MAKPTLLFYDLETTGLSPCFDQALQFAAIRTDLELNTLDHHEIKIKLNKDIVPSPAALITHQISLAEMQQGEREIDAIQKIHCLFNHPSTISLGYNTLGFDDEVLRFSFYRNLLSPYTHQYAQQCGRMDIYPITILYFLFNRDILHWPIINGTASLKLEALNEINQFASGTAHQAIVDVEITLALTKKLKQSHAMWDYICGYFHKATDIERGNRLPIAFETETQLFRDALLVCSKLGAKNNFIAPAISLGQHQHYTNQTLWLQLDSELLTQTTESSIPETTRLFRKKMGEPPILLPPEERYQNLISPERLALASANRKKLLAHPKLLFAIAHYYQHDLYPVVPDVDIDADLYNQPFATPYEEKQYREFRQAKLQDKHAFLERLKHLPRQEQVLRLLGRHYPELLTPDETAEFNAYLQHTAIDFRGREKLTWPQAQKEAQILQQQPHLNEKQRKLLHDYLLMIP